MHPIDEQTVLVTGATSGLGRALVQRLAGAGATVVAHGRDASRLHALVNNAGVGLGSPCGGREVSAQGIELRFAVNHLVGTGVSVNAVRRLLTDPELDGVSLAPAAVDNP